MSFNIEVEGGKTVKLPTAGKYCDRDIIVTATGGGYTEEDIAEAIEQGIQTERGRFWDEYQQNGKLGNHAGLFAGAGWTAENLKPKYDIIVNGTGANMFYYSGFVGDLAQHFEDLGIRLDTSQMTTAHSFANSAVYITRYPVIDISKCGVANSSLFASNRALVTIDKLVVAANNAWSGTFQACAELVNLTIEGIIGTTGFDVHWSVKLSKASHYSVFTALSSTTSGLTVTFSLVAVNKAFETSPGAADGSTSPEWLALVATKPNWTIKLA